MIRNSFFLALLLTAILASQGLAQQHMHTEDASASCLVCAHADNTPAAESHPTALANVAVRAEQMSTGAPCNASAPSLSPRVRGPPNL
ncbi:MAG: hypothetical protein GKR90_27330 [Pseudomonadales bacterium]|nr:hypothetical protein [Pseudomonadales bacterium]